MFTKLIVFLSFLKLKICIELEKFRIFILQFDLENPQPNQKLFFQDANFLPAALTKRLAVVSENKIRRDGDKFSR